MNPVPSDSVDFQNLDVQTIAAGLSRNPGTFDDVFEVTTIFVSYKQLVYGICTAICAVALIIAATPAALFGSMVLIPYACLMFVRAARQSKMNSWTFTRAGWISEMNRNSK